MILKKLNPTLIVLPFFISTMDAQQLTQSYEKKIDSLIRTEFGNKNEPGGVFMITRKGKSIYKRPLEKQIWSLKLI